MIVDTVMKKIRKDKSRSQVEESTAGWAADDMNAIISVDIERSTSCFL